MVYRLSFIVSCFEFRVSSFVFRVSSFVFRVSCFVFRVSCFACALPNKVKKNFALRRCVLRQTISFMLKKILISYEIVTNAR